MLEEIVRITMNCKTPFIITALYVLYTVSMNSRFKNRPPVARELYSGTTLVMVVYNLAMSWFSFILFKRSFFILVDFYREFGFQRFVKDPDAVLLGRLDFYLWVFYVSKYVEILDTVIVHLNGKSTSFLQTYHHAGVIVCTWMLCMARTHTTWIFVVFNSFVHTIMYFYYGLVTLRIPTKFKKTITYMQITQFVMGFVMFTAFILFGDVFSSDPALRSFQYVAAVSNIAYVAVLLFMFQEFAKRTYAARKEKPE